MGRSKFWLIAICGTLCILVLTLFIDFQGPDKAPISSSKAPPALIDSTPPAELDRILFVNSYHRGYPWSDGIVSGVVQTLGLSKQQQDMWSSDDIQLKIYYMDTKRNPEEKSKRTAADQARALIETWQPDIVITSDDNAVKYLVVPLLKKSSLPFVFSGVNWDASEYNLPRNRVTGMIEVQPIDQIINALQPYARGTKIGFLKGRDLSAVKEADAFEKFLGISLKRRLVADFEEWLTGYRELQQDCDILLVGNSASVQGWDADRARQLVATATQIPTGTWDAWMREYTMVTFSTVPEEQGVWAANSARAILAGQSPAEIAVTMNHKARIYRNMAIAKQLEIIFPMEFIRRSLVVEQDLSE